MGAISENLHRVSILLTRINALLHQHPMAYVPPPPQRLEALPPADETSTALRIDQAVDLRPEIKAARSKLESNRLEIELTNVESKPDFEVMGSYNTMWNQSDHRFMIGAGVSVPLYRGRWKAAEAEKEAAGIAIESEIDALVDRVRSEVAQADLLLREAEHVSTLYLARLLPAASDQVNAALAGFSTGQSSFLDLIDAERNQRTVRLEYEEALADVHRRRAEIQRALGRLPNGDLPTGAPEPTESTESRDSFGTGEEEQ